MHNLIFLFINFYISERGNGILCDCKLVRIKKRIVRLTFFSCLSFRFGDEHRLRLFEDKTRSCKIYTIREIMESSSCRR